MDFLIKLGETGQSFIISNNTPSIISNNKSYIKTILASFTNTKSIFSKTKAALAGNSTLTLVKEANFRDETSYAASLTTACCGRNLINAAIPSTKTKSSKLTNQRDFILQSSKYRNLSLTTLPPQHHPSD